MPHLSQQTRRALEVCVYCLCTTNWGGATDAFTLRAVGRICVYLDREQYVFLYFYLLNQEEDLLFFSQWLNLGRCVCMVYRSKKKWPRKLGARPNKSADRMRHVGERVCQCADVNRARAHETHWMEVCYVYVTRCSGLACLTSIWNRVDRKVDRCFTNVHYLWDWDPHCISQVSASATVGQVLTLYSVCVSTHAHTHILTHLHLLPCVCVGGWWVGSWMYRSSFWAFAQMHECVLTYLCWHIHSRVCQTQVTTPPASVSLTLDLWSVTKSLLDKQSFQLLRGGPYTSRLQLS